ncbi:S8 family serine peptidase [Mesorhizobium sp. WSM2239]|uniref:S8 family serine peptidase n=2 Tax=unclassified Mesorhizobium TaxID=325217 RepID=A0AAU8DAQ3_9HYPH
MAGKAFRIAAFSAAMLAGVAPALAQTNDPSGALPTDRLTARPEGASPANGAAEDAVLLPDLLFDLFPNPAGGEPPQPDDGGQTPPATSQTGGPPPVPAQNPLGPAAAAAARRPLAAPARAIAGEFVPDEVLVTIEGDGAVVLQLAAEFGLEVRSQRLSALLGLTIVRFGIPDGRPVGVVLAQLAADGRAQSRAPNHVYDLQQAPAVINYAFQRIALDSAAASGKDVRIAVIDTAVDETHPALEGVVAEIFDAMPEVEITSRDHGTSVAGLIAGTGPFRGMAPGSSIYHARAFEDGKSTMDTILSALDWAAGKDVRIINMSFVGPRNELLETACRNARARDMVLVAAAGNNGPKAPFGYPAAYPGVTAVTATDEQDQLMQQANRGAYVYLSAPGVDMIAPVGGGSDLVTGTSFAAAIVSGAVANLIRSNPQRSAEWIEKALAETATDLGSAGRDGDFGYGLLNAKAADAEKE